MRILQIIDSLAIGGAEKMAVNYANALAKTIAFSGIAVTRKEGDLKNQLQKNVDYLFLNKKKAIDLKAVFKLKSYCKKHQIDYIHAHGTSFFTSFLLKLFYPKIKIIWHDHTGARSSQQLKQNKSLWFCSKFFSGIIVVNHTLEKWCVNHLNFQNVLYVPNFTLINDSDNSITFLKGENEKRILCLANLRHPKNHGLLLAVAIKIKEKYPDWTFHLIGKDFEDAYSEALKETIKVRSLQETVYIYGSKNDIGPIIQQATIAVLTSISEGLPVALLEYGLYKKPVISTGVGEIPLIIEEGKNGFIVPSNAIELFYEALVKLIEDVNLRNDLGESLYKTITEHHSETAVINHYLNWINKM